MRHLTIKPGEITKPIQIIAVWFIGLILLDGTLLTGAMYIKEPDWVTTVLVITLILTIPIFIGLIFLMPTRFRPEFLDDPHYVEWFKLQTEQFKDFKPETIQFLPTGPSRSVERIDDSWETREKQRIQHYEQNRGLFLVHTWRPSLIADEGADISINLVQHGEGPLTYGNVKSVEYHLGPKFFTHTIIKTDADDGFALRISAYGSMLCLARVYFNDGSMPLDIERYINF